jgi:hypothetical protein
MQEPPAKVMTEVQTHVKKERLGKFPFGNICLGYMAVPANLCGVLSFCTPMKLLRLVCQTLFFKRAWGFLPQQAPGVICMSAWAASLALLPLSACHLLWGFSSPE